MTLTLAILGIIAALIPLGIFLIRRRIDVADTPESKRQKLSDEIAKEFESGNEDAVNARVNARVADWLNRSRVRKAGDNHSSGSGDQKGKSGSEI